MSSLLLDTSVAVSLYRYPVTVEAAMHEKVAQVLAASGFQFEREVQLGSVSERIDFVVRSEVIVGQVTARIGIECKVKGSPSAVAEQLLRYAHTKQLSGLILLTSKASHEAFLRPHVDLGGIPLVVINVNRGAF